VIEVNDEQLANRRCTIAVKPTGSVAEVSDEQPANTLSPNKAKAEGSSIYFKERHSKKA
jgi:hypothetical protein